MESFDNMVSKGASAMTGTKGQDRLDRLEKMAEAMFAGIAELKASQATYAEERREAQRKIDQQLLALNKAQDRTDEQLNRTIKKLDDIGRQLGDLGLVQGEVAEDLFFRNLKGTFRKAKMDIKKVKRNLKRKGEGEFDLVAVDGGRVLVVEVKNKLQKRMVDRFVERKLPRFKEMFPEYEKYQVVGAMGALVVKDDVGRYAEKAGLYVLTQTDEGGATLLNREGFEPKTFN
jgi:Holliday junction resolvase-like predicted endonuclease